MVAVTGSGGRRGLWRSRWAAFGAAVAVTLGGGGLFVADAASGPASSVVTVTPERILDTRTGVGLSGAFVSGVSRKLQVAGVVVPAGATGVLLNVTVVQPTAAGFVSVRPGDASGAPSTSSLNFVAGDIVPNSVQVALPTVGANAGQIDITYDAFGVAGPTTQVLADVVGYLVAGGGGSTGVAGPQGPAGSPGSPGPAGPAGAAAPVLVDGVSCTAGGLSGTIVNGHDGDGNVTVKCFRRLVTTLAGSTAGPADGVATAAQFNLPQSVAVDAAGNVYVAEGNNHRIRKITTAGAVSTLAGSTFGFANGVGAAAQFNSPGGVAVDAAGNVYVADSNNNRIRKITAAGAVSTLAGSGTAGSANGDGSVAQFRNPGGVAVDAAGNVYVADTDNNRIRKVTAEGSVSTLAGSTAGFADGSGAAAQFSLPFGVAVDAAGNVYVADASNNRIRKVTALGVVSTLAGSTDGFADGSGAAARFSTPFDVAVDASGNVYVADFSNNRIRKVTAAGVVSTLAGSTNGFLDGSGAAAQFNLPQGVAVDAAGNVYVADWSNNRIRKIN